MEMNLEKPALFKNTHAQRFRKTRSSMTHALQDCRYIQRGLSSDWLLVEVSQRVESEVP